MKKFALAAVTPQRSHSGDLGTGAPAIAAPSNAGSVQETVNQLQAKGHRVILSKVGSAPLDQCTLSSVRAGDEMTRLQSSGDDVAQEVIYTTVDVIANC